MNYSDSTIIIPTLNEEKNIGNLINYLKENYPEIKIIVADDGSRDRTQEIALENNALVLDRKNKEIKGITAAVVDALNLVEELEGKLEV